MAVLKICLGEYRHHISAANIAENNLLQTFQSSVSGLVNTKDTLIQQAKN